MRRTKKNFFDLLPTEWVSCVLYRCSAFRSRPAGRPARSRLVSADLRVCVGTILSHISEPIAQSCCDFSVIFSEITENPCHDDVFVTFWAIWDSFFSKSVIFLTILLVPHQKVKHLKIICLVHFPFLCHKMMWCAGKSAVFGSISK